MLPAEQTSGLCERDILFVKYDNLIVTEESQHSPQWLLGHPAFVSQDASRKRTAGEPVRHPEPRDGTQTVPDDTGVVDPHKHIDAGLRIGRHAGSRQRRHRFSSG
jgi:hypothetical protein